uniref:Uncharacterized protein n=1 Tax=Salix viminalis TaxID=40686 RepID=A0A6N2MYI0_SALVM
MDELEKILGTLTFDVGSAEDDTACIRYASSGSAMSPLQPFPPPVYAWPPPGGDPKKYSVNISRLKT